MKPKIIIREYSPGDYQDILNAGYPFNLTDLKSWHGWRGWILRIIYFLARLDRKVFVAYSTEEQRAIGIITLTKISNRIWGVWNIFVSPSHRRRGISTQLYQKSFEYLRDSDVKKALGSVTIDNIASIRGLEKTWDRFISQKFYHYTGTVPPTLSTKTSGIIIRGFHPRDRETLFQIYNRGTCKDWKTSLEITKKNFLDRFIGNIYGNGFSKLLVAKRILIAEHNGRIAGYAIVARKRLLQKKTDSATLFLFLPPHVPYEVGAIFLRETIHDLAQKGVKTISLYSPAHNKDTTKRILTTLNITPTTLMVPITEFDSVPNGDGL